MATRTKPAPDDKAEANATPDEETGTATATSDDALTEKVTGIVKDVLGDLLPSTEGKSEPDPESDTTKPLTAREEEARTHNIVAEAIKAFKDEIVGTNDTASEKKVAEMIPGKKPVRWIEKLIWGAE